MAPVLMKSYRMKKFTLFLMLCATLANAADKLPDIALGRFASFTNLQGRAYANVQLVRADADGVIWHADPSSGRVAYTNLDGALLQSWGIPTNRIELARSRAEQNRARAQRQAVALASAAAVPAQHEDKKAVAVQVVKWMGTSGGMDRCAVEGDGVPSEILLAHLPPGVRQFVVNVQQQAAAIRNMDAQIEARQQEIDNANAVTPTGAYGSPEYVNAVMAQRQRVNLAQVDNNQAQKRLDAMNRDYTQTMKSARAQTTVLVTPTKRFVYVSGSSEAGRMGLRPAGALKGL